MQLLKKINNKFWYFIELSVSNEWVRKIFVEKMGIPKGFSFILNASKSDA